MRLRVRLLPTVADVDAEYRGPQAQRSQGRSRLFPGGSTGCPRDRHGRGAALGQQLREIVPHEVSHAVIHHLQGVSARDDEAAASAIGLFCAAIFSRIEALAAFQETP